MWDVQVAASQFDWFQQQQIVVSSRKEGEIVLARVLSRGKPVDQWTPVEPSLEDAYLFLLQEIWS